MNIKNVNATEKQKFYDTVVDELNKVPFGTFTKKDLECLILHAFFESGIVQTRKSRELANLLEINEQKVKAVLLDIRYKFLPDSMNKNVDLIVREILAFNSTKVVHEGGNFVFAIEDPVVKIDFEQGMKEVGYYSDTSFNKEIVKVRDFALVAFLFRMSNNDRTYPDLKKMREASSAEEKDLVSKIDLKKSWLEIGKDILTLAKEGYERVEILGKIAKFVSTGSFT